jgi:hypothetical protein
MVKTENPYSPYYEPITILFANLIPCLAFLRKISILYNIVFFMLYHRIHPPDNYLTHYCHYCRHKRKNHLVDSLPNHMHAKTN